MAADGFFFANTPSETILWGILYPGAYSPGLLRYLQVAADGFVLEELQFASFKHMGGNEHFAIFEVLGSLER